MSERQGRKRVLVVAACPLPLPRGTPIRIHRMSEALAGRDVEVHVVSYPLGQSSADPPPYHHHRAPAPRFFGRLAPGPSVAKLLLADAGLVWAVRRILREQRFDIVHAHHYEGLIAARLAAPGLPVIYDAHTLLESELSSYFPSGVRRITDAIGLTIDRRVPRLADFTISVTPRLRDRLLELGGVESENSTVIRNGVRLEPFPESYDVRASNTVVFAGNLAPYQGVEHLLSAFGHVLRARADAKLLVFTDSDATTYESMAGAVGILDAVTFRQVPFERMGEALASADVSVNPRVHAAGQPQKLLNYMAAGLPVVSFMSGSHPIVDGLTGLTVPDGDDRAMADAILALLAAPARALKMGRAGREEVRLHFSWDRAAQEVEEVYDVVLGASSGD